MNFGGKGCGRWFKLSWPEDKKQIKRRMTLFIIITIAIMAVIFIESAMPSATSDKQSGGMVRFTMKIVEFDEWLVIFLVRKTAHFILYFIYGVSLCLSAHDIILVREGRTPGEIPEKELKKKKKFIWLVGTLYAVSDEIHQLIVPGRSCELKDIVIDSCGVAVAVLLVFMVFRKKA